MANVYTVNRNAVSIKLNNGTQSGVVKTVSVNLGALSTLNGNPSVAAQRDKIMNIVNAMYSNGIFSKDIYAVEGTIRGRLSVE